MSDNNTSGGGIGISGLLLVLFVGLKLAGVISWSWWWVTSPLWIPVGLGLVLFALLVATGALR